MEKAQPQVFTHASTDADGAPTAQIPADSRYAGTDSDVQDMRVLGKTQVLRRTFDFNSMLGFASTVMVAWEFVLIVSPFGLADGGRPAVFWGLLLSPVVLLPVYASLGEGVSIAPTAGGQYHWVSELAPPRFQRILSYGTGWLIALGWQTFLCGVSFSTVGSIVAIMHLKLGSEWQSLSLQAFRAIAYVPYQAGLIIGLAKLNNPAYAIEPYHQTLLTIFIVVLCALFNIFLTRRLPLIEVVILVLHVLGVFAIIIPLWVCQYRAGRIGGTHEVIFEFEATSGWQPLGLAGTIGMVPMIGMLIGYDCSAHLSEETYDASRTLPRVIMWAVIGNAVLLLLVGTTYIFCLGNIKSALYSDTYQPVVQVFYNATGSKAGTSVMVVVVCIVLLSACIGQVATASRQMWSFARDRGLPFSHWLEYVPPGYQIPIRTIIVSTVITSLLSLINIGSYTAFNAMNSLGTVSILFSYTISISSMIVRRFDKSRPADKYGLPPRRWSLGRWGLPFNIYSLFVTAPMLFFYFWPLYRPVTPENMNWSSTMFGGVLIVAALYYLFKGRNEYVGPVTFVKREE